MRRSLALLACVLLFARLAYAEDKPPPVQKPVIFKLHRVLTARSVVSALVKVVPDPRIRTVILEAWALEEDEPEQAENEFTSEWVIPATPKRIDLTRSSLWDAEPEKRSYEFEWRYGLDAGAYHFVAKLYLGNGLHVESAPLTILVR